MKPFSVGLLVIVAVMLLDVGNKKLKGVEATGCLSGRNGQNGIPGIPGKPGIPGSHGRDGASCKKGKGKPGSKGPPGPKGDRGLVGPHGPRGPLGPRGPRGLRGPLGPRGPRGTLHSNWKQCAWKKDDGRDNGLLKECVFTKKQEKTSLRVQFVGNLRITGCNTCCKRWFFTFNGAECSGPLPIDGVIYMWKGANQNIHRVRVIEGYCTNIHRGKVRVGFNVGNCHGYGNANANTGFNSVSRIIVEEVTPQQT